MEVRLVLHVDDAAVAEAAARSAFQAIAELDSQLSDYRPDSAVRRLARVAPDPLEVDPPVSEIVRRSLEIAAASRGAFDPTVAPLVTLWRDARARGRVPSPSDLRDARALVDWRDVLVEPQSGLVRLAHRGMGLDLGGIAKGFILQRALTVLQTHGVSRALVEAGGDIVVGAPPPGRAGWVVQVGCRLDSGDPEGQAVLANEALATSGATMQFVEIDGVRYSHVVDPRTGQALTTQHTVHVSAGDGATADGWATALGVLGPAGAASVSLPPGVRFCFAAS